MAPTAIPLANTLLPGRLSGACLLSFGLLSPLAACADLIADSQLNLGLRNFYLDRDLRGDSSPTSRVGSWTQGFDLRFQSGYSEGPLQFGLDASGQYVYRLDGGGGRGPDTVIPYDDSRGEPLRDYGRAALTAKLRYGKTELTIGEHRPRLPVAFFDDSRQMVSTFHGFQISSQEIQGLSLTAGRFDRIASRESANHEKLYLFTRPNGPRHVSDGLNFAGASYELLPNLSASYFYGQLEDIYRQHYLGLSHKQSLAGGYQLKTDLRYYDNREDGDALYGDIDNRSRPSRACGLKLAAVLEQRPGKAVTPLAGVWIETGRCGQNHPDWSRVTLWIETTSSPASNRNSKPSRPLRPGG